MTNYTINTWLLAHLLHPLFWVAGVYIIGPKGDMFTSDFGSILLLIVLMGVVFSLPLLIISRFVLRLSLLVPGPAAMKMMIWILLYAIMILLSIGGMFYILVREFVFEGGMFYLPPVLSATASILIRTPYFLKLLQPTIIDYENDVV